MNTTTQDELKSSWMRTEIDHLRKQNGEMVSLLRDLIANNYRDDYDDIRRIDESIVLWAERILAQIDGAK